MTTKQQRHEQSIRETIRKSRDAAGLRENGPRNPPPTHTTVGDGPALTVGTRYRMLVANYGNEMPTEWIVTYMGPNLDGMACVNIGNSSLLVNPRYLVPLRD